MPYIGEIRIFAGDYAPVGWALCQGQTLQIAEHDTLFALIGTAYGGDGQETFRLPDLAGRVPMHLGRSPYGVQYPVGQAAGAEVVTLVDQELPAHTHNLVTTKTAGTTSDPERNVLAAPADVKLYIRDAGSSAMTADAIQVLGSSLPHENMQPFLVVNFIIALSGVFPHQ